MRSKALIQTILLLLVVIFLVACGPTRSENKLNSVEPEIEAIPIYVKARETLSIAAGVEQKLLVDDRNLTSIVSKYEQGLLAYTEETSEEESYDEYSSFAIANVDKYVNVRSQAGTDSEIVGRMYDGAVAQIQESVKTQDGEWFKIVSGQTEGYIKAEYFIYGKEAARVIDDYIDRYALVNADRLNIRENPDQESRRIGYAVTGEKLKMSYSPESGDQWIYVDYADGKRGYVASEYVTVREEFIYAKTMDEIRVEEEAEKAKLARQKEDEKAAPEIVQKANADSADVQVKQTAVAATGDLRNDIVDFALQYVGNPYVHGGNSLETGTDCSGFTSLVYAQFGVGLSRTPSGQLSSNGRSVSLAEARPGDIICYGKSKCTHVAIYMGNGQIVHAANPTKGIVVFNANYDNILGVKNVLD